MPKFFQFARLKIPPALLLTIFLVSCSRAVPSIPISASQTDLQPVADAEPPTLRPNVVVQFQQLSLEEGLSQSVVNAILQDRRGFLWFGTQDGLNRYDGYNFKVYKPNPEDPASLSDGWIESLYEDKDGYVWVGTYQGGLNRYDPNTDTFTQFRHIPEEPSSMGEGMISAILQDRSGTLWVGSMDGLNKFDPASGSFTHFRNDPNDPKSLSNNNIQVIYQDSKDRLWIGTYGGGLELFDPSARDFKHFRTIPDADEENARGVAGPANLGDALLDVHDTISNNYVKTIVEDNKGNLWIGTEKGLNCLGPSRREFKYYLTSESNLFTLSNNSISTLLVDRNGTLWTGTEYGLNSFDAASGRFTRYFATPLVPDNLSVNTIFALYEDREGVLWVGTWGGGINKHSPAQDKFALYRYNPDQPQKGIPADGVFGAAADDSGIAWFGSPGSGLTRFDPRSGFSTRYVSNPENPDSLASNQVWVAYIDGAGILWLGTSYGLDRFDEATGKFIHYKVDLQNPDTSLRNNYVTQIYESPSGSFWVGTRNGLDQFDRTAGTFSHITDSSDPEAGTSANVASIFEDRDGFLWVGTSGEGVYRFDQKKNTFRYYQSEAGNKKSLSSNLVMDIQQDADGGIWLATGGGGLNKYDPATDSFSVLTERQGLPNNFIYCIIPDENDQLWLTTNFGLSRFDPRTESFQNFTTSDGLQSNEFNSDVCARSENGNIYVGGTFGINLFIPSEIPTNKYAPLVVVTSLTQNEKPIEASVSTENVREITLKFPADSFEFEFSALSFAEPKKNRYAYALEGFDTDWIEIDGKHEGRYTNLPGGEYTLRMKGSNNDGLWNESAAIRVIVVPPFWQTWWFFTLTGFVIIATVWAGYRLRIRSIEERRLELERQVAERTREIERLFDQMKELAIVEERNRLARELHDSAKQKAFAALAQIGAANGLIQRNTTAAQKHISEAENLVHDVIQELTFLIQEMYPMALKEKGLIVTLREYVYEWESRNDIKTDLRIEGGGQLPLKVEQSLYRITQETLANTARHSRAGSVILSLVYEAGKVSLRIADDGTGFDIAQKPKGVGLRSIKERAESVGGTFVIESSPGNGTQIEVIIPI